MRDQLSQKDLLIQQERQKRWKAVAAEVAKRCELENELRDVNDWADELGEELCLSRRSARAAAKAECNTTEGTRRPKEGYLPVPIDLGI